APGSDAPGPAGAGAATGGGTELRGAELAVGAGGGWAAGGGAHAASWGCAAGGGGAAGGGWVRRGALGFEGAGAVCVAVRWVPFGPAFSISSGIEERTVSSAGSLALASKSKSPSAHVRAVTTASSPAAPSPTA